MAQEKKRGPGRPKGSKNKNSSRSSNPKRKEIQEMQEKRESSARLKDIIWGVCYIALGILIFASVQFHAAGEVGNGIGDILKGLFGLLGLVLPWYLIIIGVLLITNMALHYSLKTFITSFVMLILLCLLNSGMYIDSGALDIDIARFYTEGVSLESGGAIGMTIGTILVKFLGKAGLYIISVSGIIISLLLILNTPMSNWLKKRKELKEETMLLQEAEAEKAAQKEQEEAELPEHADYSRPEEESEKKGGLLARLFGYEEDDDEDEDEIITPSEKPVPDEPTIISPETEEEKKEGKVASFIKDVNPFSKDKETPDDTRELDKEDVEIEGEEAEKDSEPDKIKVTSEDLEQTTKEITEGLSKPKRKYKKPKIDLLSPSQRIKSAGVNDELRTKAKILDETLKNFGVDARVVQVTQGPAVTRYEVQPNVGVKVSKIVGLADDIALNLEAKSIRIEAPIPGKAAVGIEVENSQVNMVSLREIIASKKFAKEESKISFAVGKDIAGNPIVGNLKEMPHLLIAGATGSGKSVCINSIITSILYKADPDEVKFVLIDPKVVELGNYNGIPHLLIPVVTDPSKAAAALSWAAVEMTNRYKAFSEVGSKDLASYNRKMEQSGDKDLKMPQVVIIIDELADLMIVAKNQVNETIQRIAQLGRAAGIHLIVATQRPSVNVITGVIKANIPARIAFAVSSQYDSKTILDTGGAEKLVGKGDMLYSPKGGVKPIRVQGTFISEKEVNDVISYVKSQTEDTDYSQEVMDTIDNGGTQLSMEDDADELLKDAIEVVIDAGQASVSMLQRHFRIGYNRSARIVDEMEERGIVGPPDGARPRQVLVTKEEYLKMTGDLADDDSGEDTEEY